MGIFDLLFGIGSIRLRRIRKTEVGNGQNYRFAIVSESLVGLGWMHLWWGQLLSPPPSIRPESLASAMGTRQVLKSRIKHRKRGLQRGGSARGAKPFKDRNHYNGDAKHRNRLPWWFVLAHVFVFFGLLYLLFWLFLGNGKAHAPTPTHQPEEAQQH